MLFFNACSIESSEFKQLCKFSFAFGDTSGKFARGKCTTERSASSGWMFAVDWPFQSNTEGRDFIDRAPRSDAAKARIFEGNARRPLRL
jgi:hypothetical protein